MTFLITFRCKLILTSFLSFISKSRQEIEEKPGGVRFEIPRQIQAHREKSKSVLFPHRIKVNFLIFRIQTLIGCFYFKIMTTKQVPCTFAITLLQIVLKIVTKYNSKSYIVDLPKSLP